MSLQGVPFNKISETDIQRLLDFSVGESVYLDYKRQPYERSERKEFLKDISAMANTLGGDLLIGVTEEDGVPSSLTPFFGDCDEEMRRLEQIAITGLDRNRPIGTACRIRP